VEVLGVQRPGRGRPVARSCLHPDGAAGRCRRRGGPLQRHRSPSSVNSLGTLVAYEVAGLLRATGRHQLDRIFASACPLGRVSPVWPTDSF